MTEPVTLDTGIWSPEKAIPDSLKQYISQLQAGDSTNPSQDFKNSHLLIFLHIIQFLKRTKRTGWVNFDVEGPESIADHMYRMGIICMLTGNEELNSSRCVKIALVHDMAESLVGDITPVDNVSKEEKHRREYETIVYLRDLLKPYNAKAAQEIYDLWNEYENISSPEARFVKDVDKFELLVQAYEYEQQHNKTKDLSDFVHVRKQIKTPEVQSWADTILKQREGFWQGTPRPVTKRNTTNINSSTSNN
ncbi:hypothetical protein AWJ20_1439 [Sugiyamaella lignohabitans]|uniref:5'-deoxynucleotidase n=1 Tax=Sugiyamaella lignohabitans TaxID=796027 RepID=A0A161HJZ1_9ASCO|nr:uncharacterized protein AWJ20_1439 [Sugiyamaella lignohabitans]ANB13157.1 hypothetical protein AWJ20_1439 [Sugiyamaella lignohabitans]